MNNDGVSDQPTGITRDIFKSFKIRRNQTKEYYVNQFEKTKRDYEKVSV